ncbi:MAG: hypothetical protein PVG89_00840, partial [Gammaproteobacteria bacterium]
MAKKKAIKPEIPEEPREGLLHDVERVGEAIIADLRSGLNTVSTKVNQVARNVASEVSETTTSVADGISERTTAFANRVSSSEFSRQFKDIIQNIEDVGEDVFDTVYERLDHLKGRILSTTKPAPKTKKGAKKKAAKKAAKKKAGAKKVVKKKKTVKKKPV